MKVIEVIVSAGRTFNHPHENYSNLRPQVTVKATLDDGDDFESVTRDLQARAEQLVEDHKQNMLRSIEELEQLTQRQQEVARLADGIRRAQSRLDEIRAEYPQLPAPPRSAPEE